MSAIRSTLHVDWRKFRGYDWPGPSRFVGFERKAVQNPRTFVIVSFPTKRFLDWLASNLSLFFSYCTTEFSFSATFYHPSLLLSMLESRGCQFGKSKAA